MGMMKLTLGKLNVPLDDILNLSAGFYAGYVEELTGNTTLTSDIMLYGPTIGTAIFSTGIAYAMNAIADYLEELVKLVEMGQKIKGDFSKEQLEMNAVAYRKNYNITIVLRSTGIAALETMIGYYAGKMYAKLN